MNPHEGFVDDVKAAFRQEAVDVGHTPVCRVLDRKHSKLGFARGDSSDDILERAAGQRLHPGTRFPAGLVRIGAEFPLKCDASRHVSPRLKTVTGRWSIGRGSYPLCLGKGSG